MSSTAHFGFTKLLVADLEASARFYTTVFGLEENDRVQSQIAGRAIEELLFHADSTGAATLVLLTFVGTTTPSSDEVILGFITPDVAAVCTRAAAAGGRIIQEPQTRPEHGVSVGFIEDNEGHLIEVVQLLARPS